MQLVLMVTKSPAVPTMAKHRPRVNAVEAELAEEPEEAEGAVAVVPMEPTMREVVE